LEIIKLNAIDSTNSFLKDLMQNSTLKNYTTVVAKNQLSGRGQQENHWHSENGKNLLISMFIRFENLEISLQKYLNFAISLAVFDTLSTFNIPKLKIKWPNDILADNKKLSGILIENSIHGKRIKTSIIGIGLNVNQKKFPLNLPKATSIIQQLDEKINLDELLALLLKKVAEKITLLNKHKYHIIEKDYLNVLYKKNIPTTFKDSNNVLFMGIIKGISDNGNLLIELENNIIKEFGIKEISIA